jgi:hypothetical protein
MFQKSAGKELVYGRYFFSILRLRRLESNAPDKYAEGFYCRKAVY